MICASTWSRLPDKKDWHFRQLLNNKKILDIQDRSTQDNLFTPQELLFQGDGKRQVSTFLGVCTTQSKDATLSSPCVADDRVYQLLFITINCSLGSAVVWSPEYVQKIQPHCLILRGAEAERKDRNCYSCNCLRTTQISSSVQYV